MSDKIFLEAFLFCLGSTLSLHVTSLQKSGHDVKHILNNDVEKERNDFFSWDWGIPQRKSISVLVQIMQGQFSINPKGNARLKIIQTLKDILISEGKFHSEKESTVKNLILHFWNQSEEQGLNEFVLRDICLRDLDPTSPDFSISLEISRNLCFAIAYLTGIKIEKTDENLNTNQVIYNILRKHIMCWVTNESLDHVVCLLFLLSARNNGIGEVAADLLTHLIDDHNNERILTVLEMFYKFLCGMYHILCFSLLFL